MAVKAKFADDYVGRPNKPMMCFVWLALFISRVSTHSPALPSHRRRRLYQSHSLRSDVCHHGGRVTTLGHVMTSRDVIPVEN